MEVDSSSSDGRRAALMIQGPRLDLESSQSMGVQSLESRLTARLAHGLRLG